MMTKEAKKIAIIVLHEGEIIDTFKFKMLSEIIDNKCKMIEGITYTVKYLNEIYIITKYNNEVVYFHHQLQSK